MWNFQKWKEIVYRRCKELLMYNRIQFRFKRYLRKKGDAERRLEL